MGELLFQTGAYCIQTEIVVEAIGQNNPVAATTFISDLLNAIYAWLTGTCMPNYRATSSLWIAQRLGSPADTGAAF